jgi:uncharacterized membrane protein
MQLNFKQYKILRIIVAFSLGVIISQAVIFNNYLLVIFFVAMAMVIILVARKQVKEILADERDYQIAGKAARYAMTIFSIAAVVVMFFFVFQGETNPVYQAIGFTLSYSVCGLLLLNSAIFYYFNKYEKQD